MPESTKSATSAAPPRRPRTAAQRAASRANGAHSRGPATSAGKTKSKLNAVTHGLSASPAHSRLALNGDTCAGALARALVLRSESTPAFQQLLAGYRAEYQPCGQTEADLVEELAVSKWLQRRCWAIQTAILDLAMDRMAVSPESDSAALDDASRTALAFTAEADRTCALHLLSRYSARHARDYHRALDKLRERQELRKSAADSHQPAIPSHTNLPARPSRTNGKMQNEPEPGSSGIIRKLLPVPPPRLQPAAADPASPRGDRRSNS